MESTHQYQIPLHNLSIQLKHEEIPPTLPYSLISIGKLCDDKYIVTFDKHRVILRKKVKIIEGYQDPMNLLWSFPLHHPDQGKKKSNIISHSTRKNWCQHIKPMAPRHPRAYHPTSQQYFAIFYHQIICYPKNAPYSRQ